MTTTLREAVHPDECEICTEPLDVLRNPDAPWCISHHRAYAREAEWIVTQILHGDSTAGEWFPDAQDRMERAQAEVYRHWYAERLYRGALAASRLDAARVAADQAVAERLMERDLGSHARAARAELEWARARVAQASEASKDLAVRLKRERPSATETEVGEMVGLSRSTVREALGK